MSISDTVEKMMSFRFSGSKSLSGEQARVKADRSPGVDARLQIENKISDIGWNVGRVESALGEAIISHRNCQAALQDTDKDSFEFGALSRESERLEKEIAGLKAKLGAYEDKRKIRTKELEKSLEAYKTAIDAQIGNIIYSSMVQSLRTAVADAKDLHAGAAAELDAIEKKYNSKIVKGAREKIDSALKTVQAVEKILK